MKSIVTSLILLLSLSVFGQQISWEEWGNESKTDIRMLPKYGSVDKTEQQKESDRGFIQTGFNTPQRF